MITRVVDTNVAVVANGRDTHASIACKIACIELLSALRERGQVAIDVGGSILLEYAKRLCPQGQPGVGDLFYRHVLDNQGNPKSVIIVDADGPRAQRLKDACAKGDLAAFDEDDRVFACAAAVGRFPVAVAIDSDWPNHEAGLQACGIRLDYVCGKAAAVGGGVE